MNVKRVIVFAITVAGCSGSGAISDGPTLPGDGPGHTPGMPGLGAHGLSFYHLDDESVTISTPARATQPSDSTILVSVGRGDRTLLASLPTDNKGNAPYRLLGSAHAYEAYPDAGTAVYAFTSAAGGPGFQVTTVAGIAQAGNLKGRYDEVTLAAVEIIEGTRIQAFAHNEPRSLPITSASVTTTGPATLVAFWWGDGFPGTPQSATPNNGFQRIDTNAEATGSFVQCAVAVKNVTTPGTYDVTWTSVPEQGAQLWLIAVE